MTTADTQDVVTPNDSRNGEAGRLCVQRLVSRVPWSQDKKKKHREYMKSWQKKNRDKQNRYVREFTRRNSISSAKLANRKTWKNATMAREPWSDVDDAMLFSGMTQGQLAKELGRSKLAIQRRKWRLRQYEAANAAGELQPPPNNPK